MQYIYLELILYTYIVSLHLFYLSKILGETPETKWIVKKIAKKKVFF